ncbi:protein kinase [Ramlibacter sp.]|uniref:protein kinase domain-containing protein n=1 Tax=Ramlibacter sp. TaxID=1917967 RepID=UPI0017A47F16|nr:protein kinase [Ramlibacter sp.]MBA2676608.1 protein kinase [Ramlibacter sp.]
MPAESYSEAVAQFPETEASPLESSFGPSSQFEAVRVQEHDGTISTFMYARLHNFAAVCQRLGGSDLTHFVNDVRRIVSTAVAALGGEIAQRRPDSILCVFSHRAEDRTPNHARRALHAAVLTVHESVQLALRIAARPDCAGLPPLAMAVGVHLGVGEVTPRMNKTQGMVHAVGEAVEIARLLEMTAADLHWSVVTSGAARQGAGPRVASGRSGSLGLPDETFLEVVEIAGLVAREGSTTPASYYEALRTSLQKNQQLLRSAAHAVGVNHPANMQYGGPLLIEGYRLLRKIGEGGIASIFLAQPAAGGAAQVLKVLRIEEADAVMGLQRFMQEFALLAQIDHPNVARIHRQDFSAGNAFIAMEYFPLGDLRARMRRPLDPGIAMYYLRQIAAGLEAIHQVGVVHRDLKPDNVMLRQDGTIAIADFGVAKQVSMLMTDTGAGEVVGTPYYLSPEQALGRPVDRRCDIYSLGVLAFEMLTGGKPYHADTAQALLQLHVQAPVPQLPPAQRKWQPILERMMAKNPDERFDSATALLDALEALE